MESFFAYISRMRYITRWALMRNTFSENIQEHSHMVAVLAHALAVIRNEYFGGSVDEGAVAAAALYHDASEILTGDLPTPIKYYNPSISSSYKAVEGVAQEKLLTMLPPELRGHYAPLLAGGTGEEDLLFRTPREGTGFSEHRQRLYRDDPLFTGHPPAALRAGRGARLRAAERARIRAEPPGDAVLHGGRRHFPYAPADSADRRHEKDVKQNRRTQGAAAGRPLFVRA